LPRHRGCKFLFSFTGKCALTVTGDIKRKLDRRMLRTLKAMARERGDDPHSVELQEWHTHDLRRVVRSGLSALKVPHVVCEAILAHTPPGIVRTYDVHEYQDEKREALEVWARRIEGIVNPPPSNVIRLRERRR
jgi:hypothetical protein